MLSLQTRKIIYLTAGLLSELRSIARSQGGCDIEVKDEEEMCGVAAYIYLAEDIDHAGHTVRRHSISLTNRIDIKTFCAEYRPEIDFGKIPRDHIFYFVVHHEIGHALNNARGPNRIRRHADGTIDEDETHMYHLASELLADRYAWKSVFPSQPLPRRTACEVLVRSLEAFIEEHRNLFKGLLQK